MTEKSCLICIYLIWVFFFNRKKSSTKKSGSSSANTSGSADETVIGYYLCSEPIPYRITVQGKHITLAMFKQLIGRKGNFK